MNYLVPERLDRLAREYALGTLAGPARRRFERVLRESPQAGVAVDQWRERLSVLNLGLRPMQPPVSTWRGIEARLFASAPQPAPAPASAGRGWLRGLFSSHSLGGALAGVLLCMVLLRSEPGLLGLEPQRDALPASYVGLLLDAQDHPALVASSRRQGRQLTLKLLQPLSVPPGQVAQLWALPQDGGAPFPVGLLPVTGSSQVTLPEVSEKLFARVSRLAVSLEPRPAQAGEAPSGAFVLTGHCVKVW